jgi:hypothetical protein
MSRKTGMRSVAFTQRRFGVSMDRFEDLFKKENEEAALNCSSEMVLNALSHADECLFYLAGIKNKVSSTLLPSLNLWL